MSDLQERLAKLSPAKRRLFQERLAEQLAAKQTRIPKRESSEPGPLSFAQERLWVLHQLEPEAAMYNMPKALDLKGSLNLQALKDSLKAIVERHEVLRTVFTFVNGESRQVVAKTWSLDLPVMDLRTLPKKEREIALEQCLIEHTRRPFDLNSELMLRAALFRLEDDAYTLLLVVHHIASDHWSTGILLKELCALYEGFVTGQVPELAELSVQYADYASWQSRQAEAGFGASLAYWQDHLAGELPVLQLPTDHPRPAVQSYRGARYGLSFSPDLTQALTQLGRDNGATLFMTLLAAFKVLLYRYTGQEDILIGTVASGRKRLELENLIGFFIDTLVLRTDLSAQPTFRELLERVREVTLGAYRHQDVPFEHLLKTLQPERNLSRSPLFQVMFDYTSTLEPSLSLPDLSVKRRDFDKGAAVFDLTLYLKEQKGMLTGMLEYSTDLFEPETIRRMAGHFEVLLKAIVDAPGTPITQLPLLSEEEHAQFSSWNATQKPYPQDVSIPKLFEAQAARTPDALAFSFGTEQLSYRQLNAQANRLAHYLRTKGVTKGVFVGVCLERSLDLVVALLAILKVGGVYVPLDASYPEARLRFMLEDAEAAVLITKEGLLKTLPQATSQVICLNRDASAIAEQRSENFAAELHPDDLAYVIYTSGSTGQPKGVAAPHKQLLNRFYWMWEAYPFAAGEVSAQKTALNFIDSFWELLGPLLKGVPSVIIPDDSLRDPDALVSTLAEHRVTRLWVVPSLLQSLLDTVPDLAARLPDLTFWVSSGEALSKALLERFQAEMPHAVLYNLYGTSEVWDVTWYTPEPQHQGRSSVPIGRPIDNLQAYILDAHLQRVPVGVSGELYVGGDGLAAGYLNRLERTAETFIPNPFSENPDARLYKTGDLARYLPGGTIDYLGRLDHQLKLRGFRVEPGEVEGALLKHPEVRAAVVVAREVGASEQLVAYVVTDAFEPEALRGWLERSLPDYMVPKYFIKLDALPLTPNGKVDRSALPEPGAHQSEGAYLAPRSESERVFAEVWAEVLGLDRVGINDNFFELGGDSLLAMRVLAKARQHGLYLQARQLFQSQTIAALTEHVEPIALPLADQAVVSGPVPLTPSQRRFLGRNSADAHHWNIATLLEPDQRLDPELLKQALKALITHHDALRLRFYQESGGWRQENLPPDDDLPVSLIDLSDLPEDAQSAAVERHCAEVQASLDLSEGPLLRVVLFELGKDRAQRLLVIHHHLVSDATSWGIFWQDFELAYRQARQGQAIRLPQKTSSYQSWAEHLVAAAQEGAKRHTETWQALPWSRLKPLPLDHPGGVNSNGFARTVTLKLTAEETDELLNLPYRAVDLLITALVWSFAPWTGSDSLLFDNMVHGREADAETIDLSRTVGFFISYTPNVLTLAGAKNPREALERLSDQRRKLPPGSSFEQLRYLCRDEQVRQSFKALPRAELLFNYRGRHARAFHYGFGERAGEPRGPTHSARGLRDHPLAIVGDLLDSGLELVFVYSDNLHKRATIERLAARYAETLRQLAEDS